MGQQIARMGNGPGQRPLLHFEIRRRGQPVDPTTYLPRK
jgi:lipoprotein NlpD